jgi:hypothetical protein
MMIAPLFLLTAFGMMAGVRRGEAAAYLPAASA